MSLQPRVLFYKNIPFYKDNSSGYYLSENGEYMQDFVWKSFKHLDSIPEGYEVQHKDGDKANNKILNLKLVATQPEVVTEVSVTKKEVVAEPVLVSVREKVKNWHKSKVGRKWHSEVLTRQHKEGVFKKNLICTNCGKEFLGEHHSGANQFCSNACKSQYRRKNGLDLVEKTCPVCNRTYKTNKFRPAKSCSRSCSGKMRERGLHNI